MYLYGLVIFTLIFSMWAQFHVNSTFNKYSKVPTASGMTGYDAARLILDSFGLRHVKIERISGSLTDHYDPKSNIIRLSESVYGASTVAALGVAAHEAGHAVQYAVGYFPIKLRMAIIPVCNIGSRLAIPLIIVGMLIGSAAGSSELGYLIAMIGVIGYGLLAFFQLVTLPVEFNASSRAIKALDKYSSMGSSELSSARKVLSAAALTYVAAFFASLVQFLRLFLIVSNSRRRN